MIATDRKISANRANALGSTGPKTAAGKRRASKNARRHGLNCPPEAEDVRAWYRVILDDASAEPNPIDQTSRQRAAHHLAEAEAQLRRVRDAEAYVLWEIANDGEAEGDSPHAELYEFVRAGHDFSVLDAIDRRMFRFILRYSDWQIADRRRRMRTLSRYRAEAEARRRKALRRLIDEGVAPTKNQNPETNPIAILG